MSDQHNEDKFWELADEFISLANERSEEAGPGLASDALLYAAARYAVFLSASSSESKQDFLEDKDEIFNFLSKQFRTMLGENLKEYTDNFKAYTQSET